MALLFHQFLQACLNENSSRHPVKHIGKRVPDVLFAMRKKTYASFTDLLYEMEMHKSFDATAIQILIKMGYFEEFGSSGKLLKLYKEFSNGQTRFSKTHIVATQQKRLSVLREIEQSLPEEDIPMHEQISFEVAHYGMPLTVYEEARAHYAILEIDDKYSPKLKLFNIATGNTGVMKMKKAMYAGSGLKSGNVIKLQSWEKKTAYSYVDGKSVPRQGVYDLWIKQYS